MTVQEALEQRKQNMQQAEQIRQDAKAAGTQGNSKVYGDDMAKTTSEIIAENQKKRAETDALSEQLNKIHDRQMAEIPDSAAKTQAVLDGTSDKLVKNQETISISKFEDIKDLASSPVFFLSGGFLLGVIVAAIFFSVKIKRIKKDCETRLNEARSALDRMLKIAAKD